MNGTITRQAAYDVLTEYYHHHTDVQHAALREALSRVPAAEPNLANSGPITCMNAKNMHDRPTDDCVGKENVKPGVFEFQFLPKVRLEAVTTCEECKHWIPGYITDADDFIPPKCGRYQQFVGHSADDFCSYAERRE